LLCVGAAPGRIAPGGSGDLRDNRPERNGGGRTQPTRGRHGPQSCRTSHTCLDRFCVNPIAGRPGRRVFACREHGLLFRIQILRPIMRGAGDNFKRPGGVRSGCDAVSPGQRSLPSIGIHRSMRRLPRRGLPISRARVRGGGGGGVPGTRGPVRCRSVLRASAAPRSGPPVYSGGACPRRSGDIARP